MRPKGLQITRDTVNFNNGKHASHRIENDMRIENRESNCKKVVYPAILCKLYIKRELGTYLNLKIIHRY